MSIFDFLSNIWLGIASLRCDDSDDGYCSSGRLLLLSQKGSSGYGIFSIVNETHVTMNGVIDSGLDGAFDRLRQDHPSVNTIIMEDCPGSNDDETNLKVSLEIHQANFHMHLRERSEIASGAVDMFLAGVERTMDGTTARIGVHSWSDGSNDASSFPKGHPNHLPYINYYMDVGFSQQLAEDFYYFTIYAAPADDIHWMTLAEIDQYDILTSNS